MMTALLNWSLTAVERNQSYMVVAIMLARANDKQLYTAWYCKSVIAYIVMAANTSRKKDLEQVNDLVQG